MKFKIDDYVMPVSCCIGNGNTFKISEYDFMTRKYKIKFVAGSMSYKTKEFCESADWNEEELTKVEFSTVSTVNTATDSSIAINSDRVRVCEELPLINIEEDKIKLPKLGLEINKNGIFGVDWSITNNEKENDNMNKILEIYKGRKTSQIKEEYFENVKKLKDNDEIQVIIKEMESQIKTILENEDRNLIGNIKFEEYTKKTKDAIKVLELTKDLSIDKLMLQVEEVEALLNMTDKFEEKQKILKAYKILDKNGVLNI